LVGSLNDLNKTIPRYITAVILINVRGTEHEPVQWSVVTSRKGHAWRIWSWMQRYVAHCCRYEAVDYEVGLTEDFVEFVHILLHEAAAAVPAKRLGQILCRHRPHAVLQLHWETRHNNWFAGPNTLYCSQ
jgi:hypothetical protein